MVSIEGKAHSHPMSEGNLADCFGRLYRVLGLKTETNTLLGFAIIQQIVDEVTLIDICIDPAEQGHGYGRLLLNGMVDVAKSSGAVVVMLEVRESNVAARHLYQQSGFTESGRRRGYYSLGEGKEDALLMDLHLV
jgi:ribosomal-protein-alanine N-acetyltransferase